MADLGSSSWSEIDAANNAVPPNGWPEGMAPSDVNNSARAQMGGEKRWWDRSNATQTTTGTSTAYVLTYAAAESALYNGEETSFVLHATCGATPTLNRDGLGAKYLRRFDFATNTFIDVAAGDFRANQVLRVRYNLADATYDIISASTSPGDFVATNTNNIFTGTNTFANTVTMSGAAFNGAVRVDVASAATCAIGAAASNYVRITNSVGITSFGTVASGVYRDVVFTAAPTLTHNATSLILPTGANITAATGDTAGFISEGSGNWRCLWYQRASGAAVLPLQQYAQAFCTISGGVITTAAQTGFTSIVRNSTGRFTCTMSTAMPSANYVVLATGQINHAATSWNGIMISEDIGPGARSSTVFRLIAGADNIGLQDPTALNIRVYA